VHAGAEILHRSPQGDDPHLGVEVRPVEQPEQSLDHVGVDRVLLVGTIQRAGQHAVLQGDENTVAHRETSIAIRSRAVEKTLPWASVLREIVPPPSSAPCSRKFRAWRFGSSKRSTGPLITPLKCRATRAAVTCFTRSG